jgi:integrase
MAVPQYRSRPSVLSHRRSPQNKTAIKSSDPVVRTAKLVQAGTGYWQIVYSEPRAGQKGWRSRTLSTRTQDPIEAQRELDHFLDKAIEKSQPTTPQDQLTVEELCQDYLAHQPRQRIVLAPVRVHLGTVRVKDLNLDLIRNYRTAHSEYKDSSMRRRLGALKTVLNHAWRTGRLTAVPYIELPAPGAPRVRWLTPEQLALVQDKVFENEIRNPGPAAHALTMFVFLASTFGARREAIRDLTWDRVDFAGRTVNFQVPGRAVTKKRRATAPMSDDAFAFLREAHLKAGQPATGKVVDIRDNALKYQYQKFFRSIGLEWCTSHVFRHTVATHMLQADESIFKVALVLADSVQTIQTTYAHVPPPGLKQLFENRNLGWSKRIPNHVPAF